MNVVIFSDHGEENPYKADAQGWHTVPLDGRDLNEFPTNYYKVTTLVMHALIPCLYAMGRMKGRSGNRVCFKGMQPMGEPEAFFEIEFEVTPGTVDCIHYIRFREKELDEYLDWILKQQAKKL